jgi:hypothetical protein
MMVSELGVWMDWDDPVFHIFLEDFYKRLLQTAHSTANEAYPNDFVAYTVAIFDKVAPPAVYLQHEYNKWRESKRKEKRATEPKPKPEKDDRWQPTNKNPSIEWCKEQDATEEEMIRAMDPNDKSVWYLPPTGNYKYGSIFRRVGNGK